MNERNYKIRDSGLNDHLSENTNFSLRQTANLYFKH